MMCRSAGQYLRKLCLVGGIVRAIANGGHVVRQRVQPDVDHVLLIARNWNAPGETAAADRQVFEAAAYERHDLVTANLRANEPGILFVKLQQLVFKGGQFEVVVLFAHRLGDAAAVGTWRAGRYIDEGLVGNAVLSGVVALVDKAAILELRKQLLHAALMALIGGADEIVIAQVHPVPQGPKLR